MSCEYCRYHKSLFVNEVFVENPFHKACVIGKHLWVDVDNCYVEDICIDVNYCPMCGSKLGDSDD